MSGCVEAMEAIAKGVSGSEMAVLEAHCAVCARCREARADAVACGAALVPAGVGPRDPIAWERGLFLRLLREEGAAAEGRRPVGWSRLALRLGRTPAKGWGRWAARESL